MPTTSTQTSFTFVNSEEDLLPLLDSITNLPVEPPSLYIDLEGINLGRHGTISILSLHILPTNKTYLIDIHSLGNAAFTTTINKNGTSLKTILESPSIPKVIFDIRTDSDALFSNFHVSVDGIRDLQLMELAYRKGSRKFLCGLAKCIEKDSPISMAAKMDWQLIKERGRKLFAPEKGGHYEVFNERPLQPEIAQYCKQDVELLPGLYGVYNAKLGKPEEFWQVRISKATKDRIELSQSPAYDSRSKSNALGWDDEIIKEDIEAWNNRVLG